MAEFITPDQVPETLDKEAIAEVLGYDKNGEWVKTPPDTIAPLANGEKAGLIKESPHTHIKNGIMTIDNAGDDQLGLAKSGEDITFEDGVPTVPKANDETAGLAKSGEDITFKEGIPSIPKAEGTTAGIVKDGTDIKFKNGVPEVGKAGDNLGLAKSGEIVTFDEGGVAQISKANGTIPGVVKSGTDITFTDGVPSIPRASGTVAGIVKDGEDITFENGVPKVGKAGDNPGLAKSGEVITFGENGEAQIPNTSKTQKGVMQVGANLEVEDGTVDVPVGSKTQKGILQVGNGLEVEDGVISASTQEVPLANGETPGIVKGFNLDFMNERTILVEARETVNSLIDRLRSMGSVLASQGAIYPSSIRIDFSKVAQDFISDLYIPEVLVQLAKSGIAINGIGYSGRVFIKLPSYDAAGRGLGMPPNFTYESDWFEVGPFGSAQYGPTQGPGFSTSIIARCFSFGTTTERSYMLYIAHGYDGFSISAIRWQEITPKSSLSELPIATRDTIGGVKIGGGLSVDDSGEVSINSDAVITEIPKASSTVLGGIKVGNNLTIGTDGTLNGAAPYTLPVATASVLGGVKKGTNVNISTAGVISVPAASTTTAGVMKIGPGLSDSTSGVYLAPFVSKGLMSSSVILNRGEQDVVLITIGSRRTINITAPPSPDECHIKVTLLFSTAVGGTITFTVQSVTGDQVGSLVITNVPVNTGVELDIVKMGAWYLYAATKPYVMVKGIKI